MQQSLLVVGSLVLLSQTCLPVVKLFSLTWVKCKCSERLLCQMLLRKASCYGALLFSCTFLSHFVRRYYSCLSELPGEMQWRSDLWIGFACYLGRAGKPLCFLRPCRSSLHPVWWMNLVRRRVQWWIAAVGATEPTVLLSGDFGMCGSSTRATAASVVVLQCRVQRLR